MSCTLPSSRRVRPIGRSNHRYSGAYLKPTARPNFTTRTPVDVIPVTYVTSRCARPDPALPARPAIPPRSGHWFITRALVVHTAGLRPAPHRHGSRGLLWQARQGPARVTAGAGMGPGLKCTCIPASIHGLSLNENDPSLLVVSSRARHRRTGLCPNDCFRSARSSQDITRSLPIFRALYR